MVGAPYAKTGGFGMMLIIPKGSNTNTMGRIMLRIICLNSFSIRKRITMATYYKRVLNIFHDTDNSTAAIAARIMVSWIT